MISVIMPAFNAQSFIRDAIKSILNQTYENFELIIVDDASKDETERMVKSFKDKRLKYIKNGTNKGVAGSLNIGLQIARGDFIARLDADDIAQKNRFKKQISFLRSHKNIGVVGSWVNLINEKGSHFKIKKYPQHHQDIKNNAIIQNPLNHSTVMFRKSLINQYGGYDEKLNGAEDYDLWLRLLKYTLVENIPEPLVKYRLLKKGVSFSNMQRVENAFIKAKIKSVIVYHYPFWHLIIIIKSLFSLALPMSLRGYLYEKYFNY